MNSSILKANQLNLNTLFSRGLTEDKIKDFDVLVLPENIDTSDDLYDAQDSITLSKLIKQSGVKCANSFDLEIEANTKERRSNDIWLGQIYIINDICLPVITGVISTYLSNLISDWKNKKDDREPLGKVHTEINHLTKEGVTNIKYDGDPETIIKILQILKNVNESDDKI